MYLVGIIQRLSFRNISYSRYIWCILVFCIYFSCTKKNTQSTASKQITSFTIAAPQLDTLRRIWVYLPKDYNNSKKHYPVIYMHDAQNLFDDFTSYVGEWHVDEFMDSLKTNQSIIIGIEHGNNERINELTPFKNSKYGGGGGNDYITFIKNTLKPHIDIAYRTKTEPEHTVLFGSSLGGLISFYAVLEYPETFGSAGIFSPSFWINPEIYDLVQESSIPDWSKFYILSGSEEGKEMTDDLNKVVQLLQEKGLDSERLKSSIIKGGKHNEVFWGSQFGMAYNWLMTK